MFITSVKLTKRKLIAAVVIVGVLLCALIFWLAQRGGSDGQEASGSLPSVKNIKTNEDRVEFLEACGWTVNPDAEQSQEVYIPEEFDDVFERYNEMQKENGFDLTKYKNKRVMRYTYTVLNHPSGEEGVQATLLVSNNRIIGGDICSVTADGFMHGLNGDPSPQE